MLPLVVGAMLAAMPAFAAATPDTDRPSAANGCGRQQIVGLQPIPSTHRIFAYPPEAQRRGQAGTTYLRVLVDKYGTARQVDLVISSGYAILDQASIDAVKDRWRWEPPPAECRESGVIMPVTYVWNLGEPEPDPIYLDNSLYPAEARAQKRGGTGKVEYVISGENKVTEVRVTSSTGSPDLDAAMIAYVKDLNFITSGTVSTNTTVSRRFRFVPRDHPLNIATLMGPAIIPSPADLPGKPYRWQRISSRTPPSPANGCGRNEAVFLEPSPANFNLSYPVEASATRKEGRVLLDVLVDKGGTASEVTVMQSSGSPILDRAAVEGVRGIWHWEAPPPTCAETGVHLRENIDWNLAGSHVRYMPGDLDYPAEAVAAKLNGSGVVRVERSSDGDLVSVKVVTSTNSSILDAAMIKIATDDFRFTPGTKELRQPAAITVPIDFVSDPNAMQAIAAAAVRRTAPPPPPPSAANDCGRSATAYLAPVDNSHVLVPIPLVAVNPQDRLHDTFSLRAQGAVRMRVLVDKDGKAASVTVAESSAPPEMERAVTSTVKENYRWDPPPPACADRGVALTVDYVYTWAAPQLQIYADDPNYLDAARQRTMGAAGIVEITFRGDELYSSKILVSSNSPDLDARMIKLVTDQVTPELKANNRRGFVTQAVPVMFMPAFVASPKQQAAQQAAAQAGP